MQREILGWSGKFNEGRFCNPNSVSWVGVNRLEVGVNGRQGGSSNTMRSTKWGISNGSMTELEGRVSNCASVSESWSGT